MSRPLGWMPHRDDVDLQDMDGFTHEDFLQLMEVDSEAWSREALLDEELALKLNGKLPKEFLLDRELHISRLWRSPETWKTGIPGSQ
ncbi:MAG TPA: phosphoenolpyruvate carboxykinase domain-containing protein [Isosphaeraceae bacterium]|nr:phosphoenolpyruvate carboxykinase domain-containing protein [Isosphaeraceae bacterium]